MTDKQKGCCGQHKGKGKGNGKCCGGKNQNRHGQGHGTCKKDGSCKNTTKQDDTQKQ